MAPYDDTVELPDLLNDTDLGLFIVILLLASLYIILGKCAIGRGEQRS